MAIYDWPYEQPEQVKVCVALKNCDSLRYDEKEEVGRIERQVEQHQNLTASETEYMKNLIGRWGGNLNAS